MSYRPCLDPTCGELVAPPAKRCPAHARLEEARRGSKEERGYTPGWQEISRRYRRAHPVCEVKLPGCEVVARDVDHIRPRRAGGSNARTNLRSVCRPCHALVTKEQAEQWPRDGAGGIEEGQSFQSRALSPAASSPGPATEPTENPSEGE